MEFGPLYPVLHRLAGGAKRRPPEESRWNRTVEAIARVMPLSVDRRAPEMGIRLAPGVAPAALRNMVTHEVLRPAAALALTRYLAGRLHTVRPTHHAASAAVSAAPAWAAISGCDFRAGLGRARGSRCGATGEMSGMAHLGGIR